MRSDEISFVSGDNFRGHGWYDGGWFGLCQDARHGVVARSAEMDVLGGDGTLRRVCSEKAEQLLYLWEQLTVSDAHFAGMGEP